MGDPVGAGLVERVDVPVGNAVEPGDIAGLGAAEPPGLALEQAAASVRTTTTETTNEAR